MGATLEVIQKRRTEKAEVRDAAREAALRSVFLVLVISTSLYLLFSLSSKWFMRLVHPGCCVV